MKGKAFDYGRYGPILEDPRTVTILKEVDRLAEKMNVEYDLIGGLAVCLYSKNPPDDDVPDIDFVLYATATDAREFIETLSRRPRFSLINLAPLEFGTFGSLHYDREIQIDLMTDIESPRKPPKGLRRRGVNVENLIVKKLINSKQRDIAAVLDLLAFVDYDKALLFTMANEKHLVHDLSSLIYHARTMAAGKLSDAGIANVIKRFSV